MFGFLCLRNCSTLILNATRVNIGETNVTTNFAIHVMSDCLTCHLIALHAILIATNVIINCNRVAPEKCEWKMQQGDNN